MSASLRRSERFEGSSVGKTEGLRHFLDLQDFDGATLRQMLDVAANYKRAGVSSRPLAGKTLALIFEKPSTRTRVSFEVGMRELGGDVVVLSARDMQSGAVKRQPIRRACCPATWMRSCSHRRRGEAP